MFENLINLINKQDLEALREAVNSNDNEKEALPKILEKFQNDFSHPSKYIKDSSPDRDFDEKLDLLLAFYQGYESQKEIYTALDELKRERMLAKEREQKLFEEEMAMALIVRSFEPGLSASIPTPAAVSQQRTMGSANTLGTKEYMENYKIRTRLQANILDRVSSLAKKKGKMDKVAIKGLIGRLITPDQSFSPKNSGKQDQEKVLLEQLYDPSIPENAKSAFNQLYIAILQILADDSKPFAEKLESMFSLYRAYEDVLSSRIELFLYPAEMNGESWLLENIWITENKKTVNLKTFIRARVKEGDEGFFTDEALKQEIVAAYLKMLFQYMGNKITFEVKELGHAHKEVLELPVFQTLTKVFEKHSGIQSLREMPKKEMEELIERFSAEIVDKQHNTIKHKVAEEKQKVIEKINILLSISLQEEKSAAYKLLHDTIIRYTEEKSLAGYIGLIDYLSSEKDSSILNKLNPRSLKSIIDSDEDIQRLIEESQIIVDEIRRLQTCFVACDEAIKSLDLLKERNTPVASLISAASSSSESSTSTQSPTTNDASTATNSSAKSRRQRLRIGRKPDITAESSTIKIVSAVSSTTENVKSFLSSTGSAPIEETSSFQGDRSTEQSAASANSAPAPIFAPIELEMRPRNDRIKFGGYRSEGSTSLASPAPVSSAPVSPAPVSPAPVSSVPASPVPVSPVITRSPYAIFARHRSTVISAPASPVPESAAPESAAPESSASVSPAPESSAPTNVEPNDKTGTTTMKKG